MGNAISGGLRASTLTSFAFIIKREWVFGFQTEKSCSVSRKSWYKNIPFSPWYSTNAVSAGYILACCSSNNLPPLVIEHIRCAHSASLLYLLRPVLRYHFFSKNLMRILRAVHQNRRTKHRGGESLDDCDQFPSTGELLSRSFVDG